MPKGDIRDISPLLQKFRNFLLGRELNLALRFQDEVASRSPPLPNLPDGPAHKLHANYYYARDARREVGPPTDITITKLIESIEGKKDVAIPKTGRTPGPVFPLGLKSSSNWLELIEANNR